jgi:hypothetical protein
MAYRIKHKRFLRDTVRDILLTGDAFSQLDIVAKCRSVWPDRTQLYLETAVGRYVPFLLQMGVLERIGKDQVRIRPEILDVVRRGAEEERKWLRGAMR